MALLNIVLGRSGSGKTTEMLEAITKDNSDFRHIILVPDQNCHEAEWKLCEIGGDSISMKAEVLSFSRLSHHIFFHCGGLEDQELENVGRMILLHRSVSETYNKLDVLSKYTQHSTFFNNLMKTVDELKANQVETQKLFDLDQSIVQKKKMEEIALICSFYDCFTQRYGDSQREEIGKALGISVEDLPETQISFDPRDRLTRMAEKLGKSDWGQGKIFWVDGFSDFTPQQLEILQHLMAQGESMTVNLLGDFFDEQENKDFTQDLFATTMDTVEYLKERAAEEKVDVKLSSCVPDFTLRKEGLAHLEAHLFSPEKIPFKGKLQGEIKVYSALNPRSEVEWVAAEILDLVQYGGHRFRDIAVVARDFAPYRGLINSIFPRYQIPVFVTEMVSILEKPVISVVDTVFQAISSHMRYVEFFRYLKTGFSSLTMEEVDKLEEYALFWRIRGNQWEKEFKNHPRGYQQEFTLADVEQLQILNELRVRATTPLLRLYQQNKLDTAQGHTTLLYGFLKEIGLHESISRRQEELELQGDLRQRDEYGQLWEMLCGCLEQCYALAGSRKMDFLEFSKIFTLALNQCTVGAIPATLDQVTAGETTRLKNHRVKTVFWVGAEDSTVPKPMESGGLFTDFDRAVLQKFDISLNQDALALLGRETTTAYEICSLPSEHFYISWPSRTLSQSAKACFVIEDILKMFSLIPDSEETLKGAFRLMAPLPALEQTEKYPFVKELLRENYPEEVSALEESKGWKRGILSPLSKEFLYGENLRLSATRLSSLTQCQFNHFVKYGLRIRERNTSQFTAADAGNYIHEMMQYVLEERKKAEDANKELNLEDIHELIRDKDCKANLNLKRAMELRTQREEHFMTRLQDEVIKVVENALEELNTGSFNYLRGEAKFHCTSEQLGLPSFTQGIPISYQGSIDRLDGSYIHYEGSEANGLYFRVVDYKSGKNETIKVEDIFYGRKLQLPLYYLVAESWGSGLFKDMISKLDLDPSTVAIKGASYNVFPSKDEPVFQEEKSQISYTRKKKLQREGIYRNHHDIIVALENVDYANGEKFSFLPLKEEDGQATGEGLLHNSDFDLLLDLVRVQLAKVPELLESGSIKADPYEKRDGSTACRYCDYKGLCFFEEGKKQEEYRKQMLHKVDILLVLQCIKQMRLGFSALSNLKPEDADSTIFEMIKGVYDQVILSQKLPELEQEEEDEEIETDSILSPEESQEEGMEQ